MKIGYKWAARISGYIAFGGFFFSSLAIAQLENPQWQSALYLDHPLVGVIWDVKNETSISVSELSSTITSAKYLLLGEKHDNPDHHKLQLEITKMLSSAGSLSALALEMMNSGVQSKLDSIAGQNFESDDDLKSYIDWDNDGWEWAFYGPLIKAALQKSVPLYAGNISTETMREVYATEEPSASQSIVGDEVMAQLIRDIDVSHCGLLPESQFPAMVRVQQARDAAMAKSMQSPATGATSLLIAGNYHARQDLGVPNYLLAAHDGLKREDIVSVSFMEVSTESSAAKDYIESTAGISAYDFIWFTPAVSNEDYCASMR